MKGQITIFIIIGIILLLAVGFGVYFISKDAGSFSQVVRFPPKIQPVHDAIQECVRQIGVDGLQKLGQTGGDIDTSSFYSTDGNAVHFSPNAQPVVASWWFMKSKDSCSEDCVFDSKRPALRGS